MHDGGQKRRKCDDWEKRKKIKKIAKNYIHEDVPFHFT